MKQLKRSTDSKLITLKRARTLQHLTNGKIKRPSILKKIQKGLSTKAKMGKASGLKLGRKKESIELSHKLIFNSCSNKWKELEIVVLLLNMYLC